MKLTDNFSLDEFLLSQTAVRHNISMDPPIDVIDNLRRLCVDILQPLRDVTGKPISISSGYRPPELNERIGGSTTSAHMFGRAADFVVHGMTPLEAAQTIRDMELPYDQLIHEFGRWVHVGISPEEDDVRLQELTAFKDAIGKTRYDLGLRAV
jgi:zinc D-Ala-D-Ala carboxypeptidase